jgi:hypothetical protein
MKDLSLSYNTSKNKLLLREYGRNVQKLVEHLKAEQDRDKRNNIAQGIIEMMGNLNPHLKLNEDYRHLLWDHLYIIAEFDLDVDCPYPIPNKESTKRTPERLPYPQKRIEFKHYGSLVKAVIDKTKDLDEEKKDVMTKHIASYMKLVHKSWNNDSVNDEIVKNDLVKMSGGKLRMEDDENIKHLLKNPGNNNPNGNNQTRTNNGNQNQNKNKNKQNNNQNNNNQNNNNQNNNNQNRNNNNQNNNQNRNNNNPNNKNRR